MRALVGALAIAPLLGGIALAAAAAPYSDPSVAGHLALCDTKNHLVTSGPLKDAPFAAKAVSDFVPPAPYRGQGAKVTLLVFQPRKGIDPGAWGGEPLTASSTFTDARHPSAEITWGDVTMKQAAEDYPPEWDGLLQLRMYTGAANAPLYRSRYAAADVRIGNGRWELVRPATLSCTSGRALSAARALAPASVSSPRPTGGATPTSSPTPAAASAVARASSSPAAVASASARAAGGPARHRAVIALLVATGAVLAGGSGLFVRRRLNSP